MNDPENLRLGRRGFLALGAAGSGLLLGAGCDSGAPDERGPKADAEPSGGGPLPTGSGATKAAPRDLDLGEGLEGDLCRLAAALEHADGLGQAYLGCYADPGGKARAAILQALVRSLETVPEGDPLEERLARLVRDDFEHERVVAIHDWYLSITECRLAGLCARLKGLLPESEAKQASDSRSLDPLAAAREAEICEVKNWGPRSTRVGVPFKVMPDGHSALWFEAVDPPRNLKVYMDGVPLVTTVGDKLFTVSVSGKKRDELLAEAGSKDVFIYEVTSGTKQFIGRFQVKP